MGETNDTYGLSETDEAGDDSNQRSDQPSKLSTFSLMHATPPGWSAVSTSRASSRHHLQFSFALLSRSSVVTILYGLTRVILSRHVQLNSHPRYTASQHTVQCVVAAPPDQSQRWPLALHMALRRWPSGWSCDSNGANLACVKVGRFRGLKSWQATAVDCDRKCWSKSVSTEDGNCVACKTGCYRGKLRHPRCRLSLLWTGRMHLENMTE